MVVHFAPAAHIKPFGNIASAVAAAACQLQLFQQMNSFSLYLPVAHQIKCGGKPGKACTDDIC